MDVAALGCSVSFGGRLRLLASAASASATALAVAAAVLAVPASGTSQGISVPSGFRVATFARGLSQPTAMAYGPDNRIYVTQNGGTLVAIRAGTRRPVALVRGLRIPLGLAWHGRSLFVSEQGRLERLTLRAGRLVGRKVLVKGIPYGEHQQDNVVYHAGRLYWGSGSTCDACRERDARSATVLSLRPDGSDLRIVARGLRNPYGLAFQPGTGRLYATVNGQDDLDRAGDPEPADMLVGVRRGALYGWPRCWPDARTLHLAGRCSGVTPPAAYLEPHSSADGISFYTGHTFPEAYRGNVFVAEWGQYLGNRFGRRVVRIRLRANGTARRVSVFASGFAHPLALLVDHRGGLLVADWGRGIVYRVQARGKA
jgi:glucose/arabinose dehydrogenase